MPLYNIYIPKHSTKYKYPNPNRPVPIILAITAFIVLSVSRIIQIELISILEATVVIAILATCIVSIGWSVHHVRRQRRLRAITITQVDSMTGEDFERYLSKVLQSRGFTVEMTKRSGDFGTDIVARDNGERWSIQAKRYSHHVDRKAVSDAVGAMSYYHCNRSMVITQNHFSKGAKELAEANHTTLVDRDSLAEWISGFQRTKHDQDSLSTISASLAYKVVEQHNARS